MNKNGKLTYLYSFLTAVVFAGILFIFANKLNISGSVVPFLLVSVFDIVNVLLVKGTKPRYCFGPFLTSSITLFVLYKIISVSSVINMYNSDGFLTDGEFSHAYALDLLMISLVISTFIFNVFLRFLISRQKIKNVSKTSIKRFVTGLVVLLIIAAISISFWSIAVPYRDAYLDYVSTFSSEKWLQFPDSRINMFDSLTSEYDLQGMSRTEIIDLLGKPGDETEGADIYNLGDNEQGHNRLYVHYDNEIVVSYEIKTEMFMADVVQQIQK